MRRRTAEPRPSREGRMHVGLGNGGIAYPRSKLIFELGDTGLPEAPVSGGSQTGASVGPAVHAAASAARDKMVALAVGDSSPPLRGLRPVMTTSYNCWLIAPTMPIIRALEKEIRQSGPDTRGDQPPPIPSITFPVPPHMGHSLSLILPVPLQASHIASPAPGASGGAWSPGLSGVFVAISPPKTFSLHVDDVEG